MVRNKISSLLTRLLGRLRVGRKREEDSTQSRTHWGNVGRLLVSAVFATFQGNHLEAGLPLPFLGEGLVLKHRNGSKEGLRLQ